MTATYALREHLPTLLKQFGIRSLLDAPCGDFNWMRHVAGCLDSYIGVDIVPELIERNRHQFATSTISFACADVSSDPLPKTDAVLCRDCFIHLPTRLIVKALANFRSSGARYLLLTSDRDVDRYHDIPIGSFRRIDFERSPFCFPDPLSAVSETPAGDRQLCVWEFDALGLLTSNSDNPATCQR
jgi:hypothetical protein